MAGKKKKPPMDFVERMLAIKRAGLEKRDIMEGHSEEEIPLESVEQRIRKIMGIIKQKKVTTMIYFVIYDIESNKVRNYIAKYLEGNGLVRVQKSVFIGNTAREKFDKISTALKTVNEVYHNSDSIILIPVSTDEIKAMRLIGSNIDFDIVLRNKNTLFF